MASSRRNIAVAAYVFLFLLVGGAAVLFFTVFGNGAFPGDRGGPPSAEGGGGGKGGASAASLPGSAGAEAPLGERVLVPPRGRESSRAVKVHGVVLDPEGAFMPGVVVLFRRPFPGAPDASSSPFSPFSSSSPGRRPASSTLPPREVSLVEGAVRSGSGGRYSLALAPGEYVISASVPTAKRGHRLAFKPERIEVPPGDRFRHDIRFALPACTVRGVVIRAGHGPLPGVGVALAATAGEILRRTESGGDGRWAFEGVAPGAYRLLFDRGREGRRLLFPWRESRAPRTSPERWPGLLIEPGDEEVEADLALAAGVALRCRVLAPPPGDPAAGAGRVFLREAPEPVRSASVRILGEPRLYSAPVKKDGSLFFPELFPGRYTACFYGTPDSRARPDPISFTVEPEPIEQEKDLSFSFPAGSCVLRGRVRDQNGRGVAGARVALFDDRGTPVPPRLSPLFARAEAACDASGRFEIRGLLPGAYFLRRERRILRAGEPVFVDRKEDLAVTLAPGSAPTVDVAALAFEKTLLEGRIEGLDAAALPLRVICFLEPKGGFETYHTSCRPGRDGSFLFPRVPLAGAPLIVWVLADLGGGGSAPCCRAEVAPEDGRYPFVILKRGE